MDELLSQFTTSFDATFSIGNYVLNIVICAIMLFILSLFYSRYGNSISNRGQLARVLVIVGITTFIIISIVKSSLALSLGLVGALSIVRFRTAIKEPEELGFFFIAISVGLGMGANQLASTSIGFAVLLLIIAIFRKNVFRKSITQNLLISTVCTAQEKTNLATKIANTVSSKSSQLEVKRINYGQENMDLNLLVKVRSLNDLNSIQEDLNALKDGMTITFIDNTL